MERFEELEVGDIVEFGRFSQANATDLQSIKWMTIKRTADSVLLISLFGLDARPYHVNNEPVTWAHCTLRHWLNTEFFYKAFNEEERQQIKVTHLYNNDNPVHKTSGGKDTHDCVFLLNYKHAKRYFSNDMQRTMVPSQYAIDRDAWFDDQFGNGWYWLRGPGHLESYASIVSFNGAIGRSGNPVNSTRGCVRPAIWLKIY